jgi:hypothetical protein
VPVARFSLTRRGWQQNHVVSPRAVQRQSQGKADTIGRRHKRWIGRGRVAAGDTLLSVAKQGADNKVRVAQLRCSTGEPVTQPMKRHAVRALRHELASSANVRDALKVVPGFADQMTVLARNALDAVRGKVSAAAADVAKGPE